ncbi:hypothetical protein EDC02_2467 [Micromonospora sp. Llam0]|uniref:methyltransferase family protein n=1 Tax=Micromonospora sp. Llam0 TaxID=2485143 RepID=UPI000F4A0912|nr:hypothetical protein [Micromonospora sp. Llam0]ROO60569.1 hypothetical protein EDC02_2467 [Micromonospora sp. Llam0]
MPESLGTQPVSAEPLWRLGTAYFSRKVTLTAAELGVFTVLADGPLTAEQLRRRSGQAQSRSSGNRLRSRV